MKLSELLQSLIDNPDDLSVVAQAKELAVEYENTEVDYQTRIDNLQTSNRNLLQMIPQPEPVAQPEEPAVEVINESPTMDDAIEAMHNLIGGQ